MTAFMGEFIGTALLLILGNGVVANVVLNKTKGNNSGWIVITFGWAIAVFVAVFVSAPSSGAHLNPAVTIGLAYAGKLSWTLVPTYLLAQFLGAMVGSTIVWIIYRQHFNETQDSALNLAVFSTSPAIRNSFSNLITELIGTFVLVFAVLHIIAPTNSFRFVRCITRSTFNFRHRFVVRRAYGICH
jgi:glycerol uptake facilitator protein